MPAAARMPSPPANSFVLILRAGAEELQLESFKVLFSMTDGFHHTSFNAVFKESIGRLVFSEEGEYFGIAD